MDTLRNIWITDPFVFKPTVSGLSVFDLTSEALINIIPFEGGVNSVWSNGQHVYLGTSLSGVYRCSVSTVSGTADLVPYKTYPDITNDNVNYLHGNGDYLCVTTVSGLDRYKISTGDRETTAAENLQKCYQMSSGDYYYYLNPLLKISGLDGNVLNWSYTRVVEFDNPIPEDNYQVLIEIPLTTPDYILNQAAVGGIDIRFIDDQGNTVPHYTELWTTTDPPQIYVNLNKGVSKLYILYGNRDVGDVSDAESTFRLFDHFDVGTVLDPTKWEFIEGISHNVYSISNSKLIFDNYYNTYTTGIKSVTSFSGGVVEHYSRRTTNTYNDNLELATYFEGGVYSYIGLDPDPAHYLDSKSDQGVIQGTKYFNTSFNKWSVTASLYYQASEYDGELLVSSGTLDVPFNGPVYVTYDNWYNRPDVEIDWIRVRSYDPNPSAYTVGPGQYTASAIGVVELHAMYRSTDSEFTYIAARDGVLPANYINDIYVTEDTSKHGGNVLFLATTWEVVAIEEKRGDELNSDSKILLISS